MPKRVNNFFSRLLNKQKIQNSQNYYIDFDDYQSAYELLGRSPRNFKTNMTNKLINGKTILITGAGGTIGSELTRQVLSLNPKLIIIVDQSEYNLYLLNEEIKEKKLSNLCRIHLVNVCEKKIMAKIFDKYHIDVIFHAAAYKHVPIVEENKCTAAYTNIYGTCTVFDLAVEYEVEQVVLVSTDKAVNPSSFMGATKRVAELYAQALDIAQIDTRFVTVRFGNVLGSTGSVAPLFLKQINQGGPITLTHPEVSRFFMTTSESVSLILIAASLDQTQKNIITHDGRIFVLDMGDPIKIIDLAHNMMKYLDIDPHNDIKIEFIGLRAGEKLFEEIFLENELLRKTGIDGVLLASPPLIDLPLLKPRLNELLQYTVNANEEKLEETLSYLVPEFSPSKNKNKSINANLNDNIKKNKLA